MRFVLTLLAFGIAAYAAFVGLLYYTQSSLIYIPSRTLVTSPQDRGLDYEDVFITTEDGVELHAWWIPAPQARGAILFLHGNAGNISYRLDTAALYRDIGYDVLLLDYRGYGRSEGRPSETGTYRDAEAAWRHVVEERGWRPEDVVIAGRSLGAAVAAWLAARRPARSVIVESAFVSVPDLGSELYPWLPVRWITRYRYDTLSHLAEAQSPVLVIHSPDDEIIPFHHGRRLYDAAPEPKEMLEIQGGHNEGWIISGDLYRDGLRTFLQRRER